MSQPGNKADVIAMTVGYKKICFFQIDIELLQSRLHGIKAFIIIHAGINDQISFSVFDDIGINGFQL